jgi:hypothetical protein
MEQADMTSAGKFGKVTELPFTESLAREKNEEEGKERNIGAYSHSEPEKHIEERSIGIETCIVYIAIPVGIAMWSGIAFIVWSIFF